jgi:hypothetical protein
MSLGGHGEEEGSGAPGLIIPCKRTQRERKMEVTCRRYTAEVRGTYRVTGSSAQAIPEWHDLKIVCVVTTKLCKA